MGWNKPSNNVVIPKKAPSLLRGLIACIVILAAAALAFLLVHNGEEGQKNERITAKPKPLAEVKPAPVVRPVVHTNEQSASATTNEASKPKPYRDKFGNWWIDKDHPYFEKPPREIKFGRPQPIEEKLFTRSSDIRIAQFIQIEPGDDIEPQVFGKWFRDDFVESLSEKIEVTEEDDDFSRELKQAVIDTRKEIADRARNGEDPSEIMNQAWDELYRLGQFKSELQTDVFKIAESSDVELSDIEIQAYIAKMNEMLADKGLPPFKNKKFIERSMKLKSRRSAKDK